MGTMAVFILEEALSVWTNCLPLSVLNDAQRKIVRPTDNASCARLYTRDE